MYINLVTSKVPFNSSRRRIKRLGVQTNSNLPYMQKNVGNQTPGLDNANNGEMSVFDRIKNSAMFFHNAYLYRKDAYNWNQQISNANELKKTASSALCDFLNYKAVSRCNIERQARAIREKAPSYQTNKAVSLGNKDEKVLFELSSMNSKMYKATYYDSHDKNLFVLYNWSDSCYDVEKKETSRNLSFDVEFSYSDDKLIGIQAECLKEISDSQDFDDYITEKEFIVDGDNLIITYKRPDGLNFDTRYYFENNIIKRIDKASDAHARYISSYYYTKDGRLDEIKVQSYSETEDGKYPVETVKSIKLGSK